MRVLGDDQQPARVLVSRVELDLVTIDAGRNGRHGEATPRQQLLGRLGVCQYRRISVSQVGLRIITVDRGLLQVPVEPAEHQRGSSPSSQLPRLVLRTLRATPAPAELTTPPSQTA